MEKYKKLINMYLGDNITLYEFLEKIPDDRERIFENCIINVIGKTNRVEKDSYLALQDMDINEDVAYKAFYLLCSLYRRRKDITEYGELFKKYGRRFESRDTYGYLKSMYLVQKGVPEEIKYAVLLVSKSLDKVNENIGIKHCYAEIVAEAFEEKIFNLDMEKDYRDLCKARNAIEEVINYSEEDYAKFYCTYGRILALSQEFKNAKIQIKKAIDKEKSDRADYSLRVGEYMKHLMAISSYEQMMAVEDKLKKCNSQIDEFNGKIDDTLSKNIEFLGFFAALVSFVITSVQMLSKQDFNEAVKLIIVLGGVQMLVIGSLSIILSGKKGTSRSVLIFSMAIITIVLGIKVI